MSDTTGSDSERQAAQVAEVAASAADAHPVDQMLAKTVATPPMLWPTQAAVGRQEDMSAGHLRILFDSDNDVLIEVCDGNRSASVKFCKPGGGGGRSMRTRLALIALMVAIEEDNAESPALAWPPKA